MLPVTSLAAILAWSIITWQLLFYTNTLISNPIPLNGMSCKAPNLIATTTDLKYIHLLFQFVPLNANQFANVNRLSIYLWFWSWRDFTPIEWLDILHLYSFKFYPFDFRVMCNNDDYSWTLSNFSYYVSYYGLSSFQSILYLTTIVSKKLILCAPSRRSGAHAVTITQSKFLFTC
jgi:hypothetical protein